MHMGCDGSVGGGGVKEWCHPLRRRFLCAAVWTVLPIAGWAGAAGLPAPTTPAPLSAPCRFIVQSSSF